MGRKQAIMRYKLSEDNYRRKIITALPESLKNPEQVSNEVVELIGTASNVSQNSGNKNLSSRHQKSQRIYIAVIMAIALMLTGFYFLVHQRSSSSTQAQPISYTESPIVGDTHVWRLIRTYENPVYPGGHSIRSAFFTKDGKRFLGASEDHTVAIWDVATGKKLVIMRGHTKYVLFAQFSPDEKR
jgi:WD40 repeat protein